MGHGPHRPSLHHPVALTFVSSLGPCSTMPRMGAVKKDDVAIFRKLLRDPAFPELCLKLLILVTGSDKLTEIHPKLWDERHTRPFDYIAEVANGGTGEDAYKPIETLFEHKLSMEFAGGASRDVRGVGHSSVRRGLRWC